jgi:hypothetical protein
MAAATKAWTGAIGNVVIEAGSCTIWGLTYNNTTGGTVVTIFDNATTNAGAILWQGTLAATTADTVSFPAGIRALNGITVNASAAVGAAGTVYVS